MPTASETFSFVFMFRSSFRSGVRRNLPRKGGAKPWLPVGAVLLAALLGGCGGGAGKAIETQQVRGNGYSFAAPAGWKVTRASHVVSAARGEGTAELVSVSVFRIAKPFRAGLWQSFVRELDLVAADYARRLSGKVVSRRNRHVAGRLARAYEFDYRRRGEELGQRLVFLFEGRKEFQLLCRWRVPPGDEVTAACDQLAAEFRPA